MLCYVNICFRKNRGKMMDYHNYTIKPVSKRTGEQQQNTIQFNIEIVLTLLIFQNMHYYLYLKDTTMKILRYLFITLVDPRHFLKK